MHSQRGQAAVILLFALALASDLRAEDVTGLNVAPNPSFTGYAVATFNGMQLAGGNVPSKVTPYAIEMTTTAEFYPAPTTQDNPTANNAAAALCGTLDDNGNQVPPKTPPGCPAGSGGCTDTDLTSIGNLNFFALAGLVAPNFYNLQLGPVHFPTDAAGQYENVDQNPYPVATAPNELRIVTNVPITVALSQSQQQLFGNNPEDQAALAQLNQYSTNVYNHELQHYCITSFYVRRLEFLIGSPPGPQAPAGQPGFATVAATSDAAKAAFVQAFNSITQSLVADHKKFDTMYQKAAATAGASPLLYPTGALNGAGSVSCVATVDMQNPMQTMVPDVDAQGNPTTYNLNRCSEYMLFPQLTAVYKAYWP